MILREITMFRDSDVRKIQGGMAAGWRGADAFVTQASETLSLAAPSRLRNMPVALRNMTRG
ncbi:hypothetical protein Pla52o_47020 [Novipirellula galeiformis]|uniref:Uncharacterized protein n=1 Tax=Novipirellula galeiformis TaxID=2528004 RepID=A0A5C6C840_9BACT|nr:hypothetical protein [Novipirellula galeiformis]TWU20187.1 hypothetical protein Pla52o_47020 [Novipirellula galeiformis]